MPTQLNVTNICIYTFVATIYVVTFLCYISTTIKNRMKWKFRLCMEKSLLEKIIVIVRKKLLTWSSTSHRLINTIIISPRGWGKSSLVNKAVKLAMAQDSNLRICYIDLFNVRSEKHFYSLLTQKVIAVTSTKWEEVIESAKSFFSHFIPKISIGTDPTNEVSIDFDWEEVKRNPDEVLNLAEKISRKKGLKIVICVDEFQNIAEFTDPDYFQKKLRSHWQLHQSVAYCLYGSKRHMMMEVLTDSSKPFYKFGNLMFLNKIEAPFLVEFSRVVSLIPARASTMKQAI